MTDKMWYFSYGSNLNVGRLVEARLKPHNCWMGRRLAGRLDDWKLDFSVPSPAWTGCGVGNIVKAPGKVVWGTLNELTMDGFDNCLDKFEDVAGGMYRRETVQVWCDELGGLVEAIAYVGCCPGLDSKLKPSKDYMKHLLAGRDILPAEYVKSVLEAQETVDVTADQSHIQK